MDKKFKSIITMFMGTGINMLLGIITVPIITHIVDPSSYGKASLFQTYINVLVAICLIGMDQAYVRFYYVENSIDYKRRISHSTSAIPITIATIVAIIILVWGRIVFDVNILDRGFIGLCVLATVFDTFTKLCVRLEQNTKIYSLLLIVHRLVYAAIIIGLITIFKLDELLAILVGTSISIVVSVLLALSYEHSIWFGSRKKIHSRVAQQELIKYSIPFVFSSIVGWAFTAADKIALQHFSTYDQLGYYSAASNIVVLIAVIQTTFSTVWVPMAVQTFEEDNSNKAFFIKSNDMMALVMIFVGASLILIKDIFAIVLGENYQEAKFIFPCLVLYPIMFTLSETTVYGINFYKKTYWHIIITSISCAVNVGLNAYFVPKLGGRGAAISTGLSYIVFFLVRTIVSRRYFRVDFHFGQLFVVTVLLVAYSIYNTFFDTSLIVVLFYGVLVLTMLILYKNTVFEIIAILKKNIRKNNIGLEN